MPSSPAAHPPSWTVATVGADVTVIPSSDEAVDASGRAVARLDVTLVTAEAEATPIVAVIRTLAAVMLTETAPTSTPAALANALRRLLTSLAP